MTSTDDIDTGPIAILSALAEERQRLVDALADARVLDRDPIVATGGVLDGTDVILAETGIGKTQASATATALVERYACRALVFSGVAGGVGEALAIGDIVVGKRVIDVDYGRVTDEARILYRPGTIPLPQVEPDAGYDLDQRLRASVEARLRTLDPPADDAGRARVVLGTIASGDGFIASPRYRDSLAARWSADAVEMEGAAICGVADRYGLPWLIVRALSDRAGEDSGLDFSAFLAMASARSAAVLRELLPLVAEVADAR